MSDRRPPVLRSAIAILALTTGMLVAAPTALMTSAGAASTRPTINSPSSGKPSHPKPNESKSYTVTFAATMDLPKGTTMTSKFVDREDSSKCLRATWDSGFNTEPGRAGPFSECAYLKSFGTFKLNVVLPNKQSLWTEVRLQQTNSPNIYFTTFEGQCSSVGNLNCSGGSDTQSAISDHAVTVPVTLGPLPSGPYGSEFCSAEHEKCGFNWSINDVAYGANGVYVYLDAPQPSPIACESSTFGRDPVPGVRKACFLTDVHNRTKRH